MMAEGDMAQLERENAELAQKLERIEKDNENKKAQYEEECKKLTRINAYKQMEAMKVKKLAADLAESEASIKMRQRDFGKKYADLKSIVVQFRQENASQNKKLRNIAEAFQYVTIGEEDCYGDMAEYKQELQKKIDRAKSEVALGLEELQQKREHYNKLKERLSRVDQPDITPELKQQIMNDCVQALGSRRQQLLKLKIDNYSLKMKLQQMKLTGDDANGGT